ncbi:hypothetical protein SAMN05421788_10712 [Filimonas lacunae]|uniref:YD repeat-containing protein n=1 Tax=Filimonas lacunae TaxID=477680 RepID=A0A1N7QUI8_9BACT|nr:hypothetical protein [Filimonas lacunae]SIT26590.1 hypothetical protein SAMN05421788_10712 [Filimonas lacunae]
MLLFKEVFKDNDVTSISIYNRDGKLISEKYKTEEYSHTRELTYNDQKKPVSNLFVAMHKTAVDTDRSVLQVYEHTGDSYRILYFTATSKAYAQFTTAGFKAAPGSKWYQEQESAYIDEFITENGVLVAEHKHNCTEGTKSSIIYRYANGLKTEETSTTEDGTVTVVKYQYEKGLLQSKMTLTNQQFTSLFTYVYKDELLINEEQMGKYNEANYPAFTKKYFYNTQKKIEKTEYYGLYDGKMQLYKIEETVYKGNVTTTQLSQVENLDWVMGYYNLAALHNWLRSQGMDELVAMYNSQFIAKTGMSKLGCTIKKVDAQGNLIEQVMKFPDEHAKLMSKVVYRNEYNEANQLDFIISYRVNEGGKPEEMDIKKYYYYYDN